MVKARRVTVLGTFLLAILLACLLCLLTVRSYTATSLVDVTPVSADPFTLVKPASSLLDVTTEQQLVKSSYVSTKVAKSLGGGTTPSQVRANTQATLQTGGTIMRITYTGSSVAKARDGADDVASAYIDYRSTRASDVQQKMIDNLQKRQESLRKDLQGVNRTIANGAKGSAAVSFAQSERQLILIQINSTLSTASSSSAVDTSGGSIVTPAKASAVVRSPNVKKIIVTGALVGLLLGLVLAFVRNALDSRVRDAYDVRAAGSGPVLGELTAVKATIPATGADLDELRTVRESVLALLDGGGGVIAVLDRTGSKLGSDVPANLASVLSEGLSPVRLLLSGYGEDYVSAAQRLQSPGGQAGPSRSATPFGGLTVSTIEEHTSAATLSRTVRGAGGDDALTVVATAPGSGHAAQLSAARVADLTVVVVAKGRATKKAVSSLSGELSTLGAAGGHVILVNRGRRSVRQSTSKPRSGDEVAGPAAQKSPEASRL